MKMVAGSPLYFPKVAILDPMMTRTLPFWQAAVSGIDALTHAIEAYLTTLTTPITDALALSAIHLIYHNLRASASTDDLDAKEACLIASTMANMACGNARLGLGHIMSGPIEARFGVPHGIAVGTLLPYTMEFNLIASDRRFARLAEAMGESNNDKSLRDLASSAVTAVKSLYLDLGFPRTYSEEQVDRGAVPEIAKMIMGGLDQTYDPDREYSMNAILPSPSIRKATLKDVMELYERAFKGWEM
jgi:alcohol dehydrogenase class IV